MNEQYLNNNDTETFGHEESNNFEGKTGTVIGRMRRDLARDVTKKGQKLADAAAEKTDSALTSIGDGMTSLGEKIRSNAPGEGQVGSAASAVADSLESGGKYLKEHGVGDLGEEVASVVKRNPMRSLAVGVGLGVILGAMFTRK